MKTERKRVCVTCGELRSAIVTKNFPTVIGCEPCSKTGLNRYIIPAGLGKTAAMEVNDHFEKLEKELTDDL